jgi:hypothetical protein
LNLDALADLELGEPAHVEQLGQVLFSAECGEHARKVTDGGDGRAKPLADVLPGGGATEVLVAASAGGLGDNLQLPALRDELDDWLARLASDERRFASIRSAGAERLRRPQAGGGHIPCLLSRAREYMESLESRWCSPGGWPTSGEFLTSNRPRRICLAQTALA